MYDCVKPRYSKKAKLCYIGTGNFIVYIKTDDIYEDIAEDVETRFDNKGFELECNSIERPLLKGKSKKSNWINKRWIRGKIMIKFVRLRAKTYSLEPFRSNSTWKYNKLFRTK